MSYYEVYPSVLEGTLTLPSSKSHTLRAFVFALMATGESVIRNPLKSLDSYAMIEAIKNFGAEVVWKEDICFIKGVNGILKPAEDVIQCGNSGIVYRFMTALAALSPTYTIITGDHSIRHQRPIKPLLDALTERGAFACSSRLDGHAPVIVKGPMFHGSVSLEGYDSQLISALLIAGSFGLGPLEIHVSNAKERPWIDLTLDWLNKMKIPFQRTGYHYYKVFGKSSLNSFSYDVPGDLSSAAFPIVSALITRSEIKINNIDLEDIQGDKNLIFILKRMGANFLIDPDNKTLKVLKNSALQSVEIDMDDCIDALPILSVLGCFSEGKMVLYNGASAREKESDRIKSIVKELKKMGAHIEERDEGVVIHQSKLYGAHLETYHDHRMAMALSVAAMGAEGKSKIEGIDCVKKSYPVFNKHMETLGAQIKECL